MTKSHQAFVGIVAAVGLGLAVSTAYADPQGTDANSGPHAMGHMHHGTTGPGMMGHGAAGHAALTAEEHTALAEKMRNATTPEERQKIAAAMRADMHQHDQANGAMHPGHHGPGMEHAPGNSNNLN